ncbi:MAG: CHASE domain-containing protein [Proteobacteria bacterium]|nr:CHASE domain-containing protein [Pseudomonadota bacterium]
MSTLSTAETMPPKTGLDLDAPAKRGLMSGTRWAGVVLVVMLVITVASYVSVQSSARQSGQLRLDLRAEEIEAATGARMAAYIEVLRGGLGLFNASDSVSRDEWRTYVDTLEIDTVLPGIQGIGYTEFVRPENRARYEQSIQDEGFAGFHIRPVGDRQIYSSITFLEPFDERNRQAFGFDMYQQETRRDAMDRARDTGQAAISGRVTLVQEISEDVQAGFLMYLPYYGRGGDPQDVDARRQAIVGFVYSPFRAGNLMNGILGIGPDDVRLEIFDGATTSSQELLYDSAGSKAPSAEPKFAATRVLTTGRRQWALRVTSLPSFEASTRADETEMVVLFGGTLLSFLVFGILWSFASTRERARELANTMTMRLQANTTELQRSNAELELFAYVASHDLKAPLRGIDHLASWIENDLGDALTGEPKHNMGLLKGRIKRLDALLSDLLDYSRASRH